MPTPQSLLASLPASRRAEVSTLDRLIRAAAPGLTPYVQGKFLAYGPYHYRYDSGREGDWFRVGLGCSAASISLYAVAVRPDGTYLAEAYQPRLPGASVGKSCVRFARLEQVDLAVLEELVREAARLPAFGEVASASQPAPPRPRGTARKSPAKPANLKPKRKPSSAKASRRAR